MLNGGPDRLSDRERTRTVTKDEMAQLQLELNVQQLIRAQLQDFQTRFDLQVHMRETHQAVGELLKSLQQ
jgi:hypothetical protein